MARSRILITGASGQLGSYLLREASHTGWSVVAWSGSRRGTVFGFPLQPVELADADEVVRRFQESRPDVVIHAAALSRIDQCHRDPQAASRINERGTALLGQLCADAQARLVYISTDLVFDGRRGRYGEEDLTSPLSVYGRTKAAGEQSILEQPRMTVVRVSLLYGPSIGARPGFFDHQVSALRSGAPCTLFEDEWRTPLSLVTAAQSLLRIADSDVVGLLHLGGPERMTRWEMGVRLAQAIGADPGTLVAARQADVPAPEPRPRDVSLDSTRFRSLFPAQPWPVWEEAIAEMGI